MSTKAEYERNKCLTSWFSTDESKRLTNLFWRSQNLRVQLEEMGFMR